MLNVKDFFLCYSCTMKNYLRTKGIRYLFSGKDRRNNQTFYIFEKTDALTEVIRNWDSISTELESKS